MHGLESAAPVDTTEDMLLGGKIRYRQFAHGHRSGFEPVLLAASVPAKSGERVLEAGTGAGAGLLCLGHRVPGLAAIGLEISPELAELANGNFYVNGLTSFTCRCARVENVALDSVFDHAFANPPWHNAASSQSPDSNRALAHHVRETALEDWISGLARALKPRGSLTLILPAARHVEAATLLRRYKFGALRLFPLWPRAAQPAKLVLIGARHGARGEDRVLSGLTLHESAGLTAQAEAVLRQGAAINLDD